MGTNGLSEAIPYLTRLIWPAANLTTVSAFGNGSASFQYVTVGAPVTASRLDALFYMSASTTASATTASFSYSVYGVIYTRNASTLSSLSSGSTSGSWTRASNSAGSTQFTQAAVRPMSVPINVNMAPGEYIVGYCLVTNGANISQTLSVMGGNQLASAYNYAELASTTAASTNLWGGMGVYSAATTGLSGAYSISGIVGTGSSLSQANIALVFRNA